MNFSNVNEWTIPEGSVSKVTDSLGRVIWEKQGGRDYSKDYFFVEDISGAANTLSIVSNGSAAPTFTVYYSTDQQHWTSMGRTSTTPITATVPANSKLYLKATTNSWGNSTRQNDAHNYMYCTGKFNVGGNIMSLLKGANFYGSDMVDGVNDRAFYRLFEITNINNTTPSNANKLVLPALTMATECYNHMFGTTFVNLITAPVELPATTLARGCYQGMFAGNSLLTSAPVLRATTLVWECYSGMFAGCTSLNQVTTYANDISATDCLANWLNNVAATGTFHNEGTAVYTVDSPSGIPQGWTEVSNYFYVEDVSGETNTLSIKKSKSSAPDIEVFCSTDRSNWTSMGTTSTTAITATVPANGKLYLRATANKWYGSYRNNYISASGNHNVGGNIMSLLYGSNFKNQTSFPVDSTYTFSYLFDDDTNLISTEHLILPATTLTQGCYSSMFYGCTSLTTAPELPATTLAPNCYSVMFRDCTSLTTAPELPATTLPTYCYNNMFQNCTSLTQAPALPATTLAEQCYSSMFSGCTSLTQAPELPATALNSHCYSCYAYMFSGCTNLNKVVTYARNISVSGCLTNWLQGVAATGDFYNLGSATYPSGASGIPEGWTEHNTL